MISTNDFKTGITIELDGEVWQVVEFQHVKPGKGAAFVRAKIKNIKTGATLERTFNAGEKLPRAHLETREMNYLYSDGDFLTFMDNETYEQLTLSKEVLGDQLLFLKENMTVLVQTFQGSVMGVQLPNTVELEVVETDPGVRGDTATGGNKPATLETGAVVKVPLFINVGDRLLIDTRSGQYISRA
ncbi:MAG: elongation factor P [Bacillota bacterium]